MGDRARESQIARQTGVRAARHETIGKQANRRSAVFAGPARRIEPGVTAIWT